MSKTLGDAGVDLARAREKWREVDASKVALEPGTRAYQRNVNDGHLTVLVGLIPDHGWHMSISHRTNTIPPKPGRNPRWSEIKEARYLFCPADVTMGMLLPPEAEFINVHETTFHLHEWPR